MRPQKHSNKFSRALATFFADACDNLFECFCGRMTPPDRKFLHEWHTDMMGYSNGRELETNHNLAHLYIDADHARDMKTRKSVTSIAAAIYGVIVH